MIGSQTGTTKLWLDFKNFGFWSATLPSQVQAVEIRELKKSDSISPFRNHSFLGGVLGHPGSVPAHTEANRSLQDAAKEQTQVYLGTYATLTEMKTKTTFNNSLGGRRA